ncbi:MAG: hypothetical protein ABSC05_39100, partial [Candidatus Solibacter sp.]
MLRKQYTRTITADTAAGTADQMPVRVLPSTKARTRRVDDGPTAEELEARDATIDAFGPAYEDYLLLKYYFAGEFAGAPSLATRIGSISFRSLLSG